MVPGMIFPPAPPQVGLSFFKLYGLSSNRSLSSGQSQAGHLLPEGGHPTFEQRKKGFDNLRRVITLSIENHNKISWQENR